MAWKPALVELWDAARHWLEPFIPGAIGAAIVQAYEPGLSWRDRLGQWAVALSFAVFLAPAVVHALGWGDTMGRAVGFVVGTIAAKAFVPMRDAAIAGASGGLKAALTNLGSWIPRRGSSAPPTKTEGEGG